MKIDYTNRLIAFIDVLGFSNLVYSKTNDAIQKYFDYVLEEFTEELKRFSFDYYLISDSVVIHTESNKNNFEALVRTIVKLQMKLITRGVIVRGGLSEGELFVNPEKNIIVGPGLINAYNLEGKANFPRVIVDRRLIPLFYKNSSEMCKKNGERIAIEPPSPYLPDFPYLDYTYKLAIVMQPPKLEVVKQLLTTNFHQNLNIDKYLWLKRHIIAGFKKQKNYLDSKKVKNWRDEKRLKIITDFLTYIEDL